MNNKYPTTLKVDEMHLKYNQMILENFTSLNINLIKKYN